MPEERKSISEILIVDDDPDVVDVLCQICEDAGCPADTAYDGIKAYELHENNGYHLIVTDGCMPGLDGLGLLKKVRQSEHGNDVHVVLVSGTECERWRECGFDDCIRKPIGLSELYACIRKYCKCSGQ